MLKKTCVGLMALGVFGFSVPSMAKLEAKGTFAFRFKEEFRPTKTEDLKVVNENSEGLSFLGGEQTFGVAGQVHVVHNNEVIAEKTVPMFGESATPNLLLRSIVVTKEGTVEFREHDPQGNVLGELSVEADVNTGTQGTTVVVDEESYSPVAGMQIDGMVGLIQSQMSQYVLLTFPSATSNRWSMAFDQSTGEAVQFFPLECEQTTGSKTLTCEWEARFNVVMTTTEDEDWAARGLPVSVMMAESSEGL